MVAKTKSIGFAFAQKLVHLVIPPSIHSAFHKLWWLNLRVHLVAKIRLTASHLALWYDSSALWWDFKRLEFPGFSQGWAQEWQNTGQPGRSSADFGENKDILQPSKLLYYAPSAKMLLYGKTYIAVLVWDGLGNVFTSRSSEASPIHTCGPMHVPSIIDCPQQNHRLHSTAMVRLNGIAKKALHQYAIRTLGKSGQDKKWHVARLTIIQMKQTQTHSVLPCLGLPENGRRNWR